MSLQLLVDLGHRLLKLADGERRADAGDHVFALRVHQVLAEEHVLAGGGIAREAYAGAGVLAQVAEDHGLHVDGCAEPVVDAVDAAIGLGALVLPAPEYGVARGDQLLQRILREVLAGFFLHQLLVLGDDLLQRVGRAARSRTSPSPRPSRRRRCARTSSWERREPRRRTSGSGGDRSHMQSEDYCCSLASDSTALSLRPRFRIVSIMPGMENLAPERTETSSGFSPAPSFCPCSFSSSSRAHEHLGRRSAG